MVTFEKHIPLSFGTGDGLQTVSTTSATYLETANPYYANVDPSQYDGGTLYFEAVIKTNAATGYASLYTQAGAQVTGSEVTTTATTPTRVRSSAITVTAGNHTVRIKNDGTNTTTLYNNKVVVVQSLAGIHATESQIDMYVNTAAITSSSYGIIATTGNGFFLYTASHWDGTIAIFFEGCGSVTSGTGYIILYDRTASATVPSSEITTTSTSVTRFRSGAVTLTDGHEYAPQTKIVSGGTFNLNGVRLIIQQSNSPQKTESYLTAGMGDGQLSSSGGYVDRNYQIYYNPANWSVDSVSWFNEDTYNSNTASGTIDLYNATDAVETTGSAITTPSSQSDPFSQLRSRSSAMTMPSGAQNIKVRVNSVSGTIFDGVVNVIAVLSWTNIFNFFKTFNETVTLVEKFSKKISKSKVETITLVDHSITYIKGKFVQKVFTEAISLLDSISMTLNGSFLRWRKIIKPKIRSGDC